MKLQIVLPFFLSFFIGLSAPADELYHVTQRSESEIEQTYLDMLRDGCPFANKDWHALASEPTEGFWGDGVSAGNQGVRAIGGMALACATLVKYDDQLSESNRQAYLSKTQAALRFVVNAHITGKHKCADGKPWGATPKFGPESWQSGMWTGTLAFAAWLVWDKLDPDLRKGVERVVAWEDDILAQRPPPNNLALDTKAEENGWEVPPLVLGELMFPTNAHAAAWHEAAIKYMMNTLCTEADTRDTSVVDGRPVNQWVHGANLQPDFTLENHNIFHPSYVGCSSYFLTQAALYYNYAGRPVSEAATHHLIDTWRMFQTVLLPWGESAYPQGMDWELHGLPFLNLYASLGSAHRDPLAAGLENRSQQYLRAWQEMGHGDLALPGSRFGITRHAINAEQACYGLIAHKVFEEPHEELDWVESNARELGVWEYPYVGFIVHRTAKKFALFSWKNRFMGQIIPLGEGHEGNPDFTAPIITGLVGSFDLTSGGNGKTTVVGHSWKKRKDGFETSGTLLLNGGQLKQTLRVTSIGEQAVVYQDRVTAVSNISIKITRGLSIGIENDEITGGNRMITCSNSEFTVGWNSPQKRTDLKGAWANVDGRLGVIMIDGASLAYEHGKGYVPGICIAEDILYGAYDSALRNGKPGDEIAHRVAILLAEATPEATAAVGKSCRVAGHTLHFTQPDGTRAAVPLF